MNLITSQSPGVRELFSLEGLTKPGWEPAGPGDIDFIPSERFPALIALINETDGPVEKTLRNETAIYLTYWGHEEGVNYIEAEVSAPPGERSSTHLHRMVSFDITPEIYMRALMGYWAIKADMDDGVAAANLVRPALSKIIKLAHTEQFDITSIFDMHLNDFYIGKRIFTDSSIFQDYLCAMLDQRDSGRQMYKPKEVVRFFKVYDPDFLKQELETRGFSLREFE